MTKSEIRAIILSKLNLRPDFVCWDVGAGTGSVTVEMALNAYRGHVYAVERREEAIPLIEQNCAAFHLGNVSNLCGSPGCAEALPAPTRYLSAEWREIDGIISVALRINPDARVVVTVRTRDCIIGVSCVYPSRDRAKSCR